MSRRRTQARGQPNPAFLTNREGHPTEFDRYERRIDEGMSKTPMRGTPTLPTYSQLSVATHLLPHHDRPDGAPPGSTSRPGRQIAATAVQTESFRGRESDPAILSFMPPRVPPFSLSTSPAFAHCQRAPAETVTSRGQESRAVVAIPGPVGRVGASGGVAAHRAVRPSRATAVHVEAFRAPHPQRPAPPNMAGAPHRYLGKPGVGVPTGLTGTSTPRGDVARTLSRFEARPGLAVPNTNEDRAAARTEDPASRLPHQTGGATAVQALLDLTRWLPQTPQAGVALTRPPPTTSAGSDPFFLWATRPEGYQAAPPVTATGNALLATPSDLSEPRGTTPTQAGLLRPRLPGDGISTVQNDDNPPPAPRELGTGRPTTAPTRRAISSLAGAPAPPTQRRRLDVAGRETVGRPLDAAVARESPLDAATGRPDEFSLSAARPAAPSLHAVADAAPPGAVPPARFSPPTAHPPPSPGRHTVGALPTTPDTRQREDALSVPRMDRAWVTHRPRSNWMQRTAPVAESLDRLSTDTRSPWIRSQT